MIFNIIIVFISLNLENIFNLYFSSIKFLSPLFTLLSLQFCFFYFQNDKKDYLIFTFIIGLIYDLLFTHFYILNAILFTIIGYFIYYIFKNHKYNLLTLLYSSIFSIFLYNFLLFLIFNFYSYQNYTLIDLSIILRNYLIGNIIYSTIIYLLLKNKHFKYIINN